MPRPRVPPALKPALTLLACLAALDLAARPLVPVWERHSPDDYAERLAGAARAPRDLLFVGGSPVSEGLDPAAFAGTPWRGAPITSPYSLGLPGGTATDFAFALRSTVEATGAPPRLVVYGAAPTDLNDARNEPHGAYSLWGTRDWLDCWHTRPDSRSWATRRFSEGQVRQLSAVWTHRHGIRMSAAAALERLSPGAAGPAGVEMRKNLAYSDALRSGLGYAPAAHYVSARYDLDKLAGKPPAPFGFLDKYRAGGHAQYLDRMAEWCAGWGGAFVVVRMPVTTDLEAKYPAELALFEAEFARFRAAYPAVRVLDAARPTVGLTDADFGDIIHLNGVGCGKLSRFVRAELEALEAGAGR